MEPALKDRIRRLLSEWQAKRSTAEEVQQEAEGLWEAGEPWPEYPDRDPQSIVAETLMQLAMMHVQWIIPEDIPVLLEFLDTPAGEEEQAWQKWKRYWDEMDMEARRKKVEGNIFYTA